MKLSNYLIIFLFLIQINLFSQNQPDKLFYKLKDSSKTLIFSNKLKEAQKIIIQLEKITKNSTTDTLKMVFHEHKAQYYFMSGDYSDSANELIIAAEIAKNADYQKRYWDMKNNLGLIFSKLGEYRKAKSIYQQIVNNTHSVDEDYVATYANLGSAYQNLQILDSAQHIFRRGFLIAKDRDYTDLSGAFLKFMAKNELLLGNYPKTIEIVNNLESNYWGKLQSNFKDDALYYRSQAYVQLNQYILAEQDFNKMMKLMDVQKKDPVLIERLSFYSELKFRQKKFKEAYKIQLNVVKLKDSFNNIDRRTKVLEIEEKYQTEKKEKENLLLKKQAADKDLTISRKNNILLISILGFIIIIIIVISYYLSKYRNKNIELSRSIKRRTELENKLSNVRENIAQDFHDDLGNQLASITVLTDLLSKRIENNKSRYLLNQIKNSSDNLYKGTKDFIWSLRKDSDELEQLITYLSDFAEAFFQKFDIDFIISKNVDQNIELPFYWSRQLTLIFKEAMTNVVKHSKCTNCILEFKLQNSSLSISLHDNGIGIKEDSKKTSNGLRNMTQRAKKIKGNLSIKNHEGTLVLFEGKLTKYSS